MSAQAPATSSNNANLDRYPGIRPFSSSEGILFYGRTAELNELLNSIKAYNLFVLHSKSGLGKTSLLNAGLMPLLEKEGYIPIEILFRLTNVSGNASSRKIETPDPFKAIEKAFEPFIDTSFTIALAPQYKTLWIYLKLLREHKKTPVLIFDQFEEFFSYPDKQKKENIIRQMAELLNDKAPDYVYDFVAEHDVKRLNRDFFTPSPVRLLFSIRSDKLALMDELKTHIPTITNKRFQLNPLFRAQAKQAILLPASLLNFGWQTFKRLPFEYEDKALETILKVLSSNKRDTEGEGEIESTQLQIICGSIESKIPLVDDDGNTEEKTITEGTFNGEEGLRSILQNFYDDQLKELSKKPNVTIYDIDRVREMIETKMIYEGMRVGLLERQVTNFLKDVETLNDENERMRKASFLIGQLIELRLIRPEESYLGTTFVITHDTLIEPITESHKQYVEDKSAKASSIYLAFLTQLNGIPDLNNTHRKKIIDLIETRMLVNGARVEIKESDIYSQLDIPQEQVKGLIYDGISIGLLKAQKTDNTIGYQLANDFLIEPIRERYNARKAEADKKRRERFALAAGALIFILFVGAVIVAGYFKKQTEKNNQIIGRNLNYEAEQSYEEGKHAVAYALWTEAKNYNTDDRTIEQNLSTKLFAPYVSPTVKVSYDQRFVGTLSKNNLLVIREDSTDNSHSQIDVKSFTFAPNAPIFYAQDTAGRFSFWDLQTRKHLHYKNDSINLDTASFPLRERLELLIRTNEGGDYFRLTHKRNFYFWNFNGTYLQRVSDFYNKYYKLYREVATTRLRESGTAPRYQEKSLKGNMTVLLMDRTAFLLDLNKDSVYELFTIAHKPGFFTVKQLSSSRYTISTYNAGKTTSRVLDTASRRIIYTSAPMVTQRTLNTEDQLATVTDKGLQVTNFLSGDSSITPLSDIERHTFYWLNKDMLTVFRKNTDSSGDLYLGSRRQQKPIMLMAKNVVWESFAEAPKVDVIKKTYVLYQTLDSTLYIYNSVNSKITKISPKVISHNLTGDSSKVLFRSGNELLLFDLQADKSVKLSTEARDIFDNGKVSNWYMHSNENDTLKIFDIARNLVSIRKPLEGKYDIKIEAPKFLRLSAEGENLLLYLDPEKNSPANLMKRFQADIKLKLQQLGVKK